MLRREMLAAMAAVATAPRGGSFGAVLPVIPPPTGPNAVGARTFAITDPSRAEAFPNGGGGSRKFVVTARYPAPAGTLMPYGSANWWNDYMYGSTIASGLADSTMSAKITGCKTYSTANAAVSGTGLPVVLLSAGFGLPRIAMSALAEDLASYGYLVLTLGHVYESMVEETPSGMKYQYKAVLNDWYWQTATQTRVGDLRAVIDQLPSLGYGIGAAADLSELVVAGHSLGGAAGLALADSDVRVRAVLCLDSPAGIAWGGVMHVPDSLPCPVMSLSTDDAAAGITSPSWGQMLAGGTNGYRFYDLLQPGAKHLAYTDFAVLTGAAKRPSYVGSVDPLASIRGTRAYALAFAEFELGRSGVDPLSAVSEPGFVLH